MRSFIVIVTWCVFGLTVKVVGQEIPPLNTKPLYYININQVSSQEVINIFNSVLSFDYYCAEGDGEILTLTIKDWKQKPIASYRLKATLGLNQFLVDLENSAARLEDGGIYNCVLKQGGIGKKPITWSIQQAPLAKVDSLIVQIQSLPKIMNCSDLNEPNLIEFYGQVTGGTAPYTLNWYVTDENKTNFLYQPKEDVLPTTRTISMISVDKNPQYTVLALVTDACGRTGYHATVVGCAKKKKTIHSIFINPLDLPRRNTGSTEFNR
jgi:hypothetical protein